MSLRTIPAMVILLAMSATAPAESVKSSNPPAAQTAPAGASEITRLLPDLQTQGGASSAVKWAAAITVLSIAPAVLILVTCFTRIVVVLGLLRQALATQQLPPNQVMFGLALAMTLVVMMPVYQGVHRDAIAPYMDGRMNLSASVSAAESHVREFMIRQMEAAGNADDVYLFLGEELSARQDLAWRDVPTLTLIPAFTVSELKVAFLMGFRIFLPFLIVDMLVSSMLVSMGMLMLPPVLVSLPLKLLLFVMADGWRLVAGTLMRSFA
jgi:flagellar biosynthetic protein FliP